MLGLVCAPPTSAVEPGENGVAPDSGGTERQPESLDAPAFIGNPEIKERLDSSSRLIVAGERVRENLLRRLYTGHDYQTIWENYPAEANNLLKAVLRGGEHGLDPRLFHSSVLGDRGSSLSPVERDLLLSDAFLSYADALARGVLRIEERIDDEDLTPEPVDIIGVLDAAIAAPNPAKLIEALAPSSAEYATMRRAYVEYRAIADAGNQTHARNRKVTEFVQEGGHATAERRARQLAINLERLRWLPRHIPPDRVVVNSAIARLQLFRNDRPVFTTRVVVGEFDKQTPELQSTINDVLFNPPWNIPRSIAQKEILPKLTADPDYLSRHHMRWRSGGSLQQEAGPYSALGRLKFEMADRYDVYLHDTPQKSLFLSAERMMSHGCVRVENPRALAQLLLNQSAEAVDRGIALGYTNRRALPAPLPIFIVYQTAYVEADGSVQFHSDPYERDDEVWQHLTPSKQAVAEDVTASQRKR